MNFKNVLNPDFVKMMSPEFICSMVVMLLIIVFSFVVYFKQKKVDPLEKPHGIVALAETLVEFGDKQVSNLMGCPRYFSNFAAYVIPLYAYIFIGFFIGMMGFPIFIYIGPSSEGYLLNEKTLFKAVPNPFDNLAFTLSISFLSVVLIEFTKMRTQKWDYYKQFVFTFPPLLPLATNFTPMLSLGIRLFGNSFAGVCIMTLVYGALDSIGGGWGLVASPLVMPFLHAYFDLFSGFIQALVFTMITMMDIAQEAPDIESEKQVAESMTLKAKM
ncbi:MAG: F0F1 ATP synthase subunit A [Eubacteriales bacterium]|nr:F0F1 ATP synthase subunit A [Eubacteriales bacterium]